MEVSTALKKLQRDLTFPLQDVYHRKVCLLTYQLNFLLLLPPYQVEDCIILEVFKAGLNGAMSNLL